MNILMNSLILKGSLGGGFSWAGNLSRAESQQGTWFKVPVPASLWLRGKLVPSDVWGGCFLHKSSACLFQRECVHAHLFHACWGQRWSTGLGQLTELVWKLGRCKNQVAMLGFKKISLTESEWINSLGFKPAGIVRYKGLKGFLMWLSSVQKIGLLVWALLLSHWSLFCIVLSTTETGGWSLLSWIIWQDLALLLLSKIFFCEGGIDFCQCSHCWVIAEEYQVVIISWALYVAGSVRGSYYTVGCTSLYDFPV